MLNKDIYIILVHGKDIYLAERFNCPLYDGKHFLKKKKCLCESECFMVEIEVMVKYIALFAAALID